MKNDGGEYTKGPSIKYITIQGGEEGPAMCDLVRRGGELSRQTWRYAVRNNILLFSLIKAFFLMVHGIIAWNNRPCDFLKNKNKIGIDSANWHDIYWTLVFPELCG